MNGWAKHHATGSGPNGHLDPELVLEIPRESHDEIHALWIGDRINTPAALRAGPPAVATVELRLRRLAPTLDVAAGLLLAAAACCAGAPIVAAVAAFLILLSDHVERWANELADYLTKE